jgi:hypothetical protein
MTILQRQSVTVGAAYTSRRSDPRLGIEPDATLAAIAKLLAVPEEPPGASD